MKEKIIYENEENLLQWSEKFFLELGWEVFKEVSTPNGYCDQVIKKVINGEEVIAAFEGKMSCNDKVIKQAEDNLRYFEYSFIIIPSPPNYIYKKYLKEKEIGYIVIKKSKIHPKKSWLSTYNYYQWSGSEKINFLNEKIPMNYGFIIKDAIKHNPKYKNRFELHELHKSEVAGKAGCERITPYKLSVLHIKEFLEKQTESYNLIIGESDQTTSIIYKWVFIDDMIKEIGDTLHWYNIRQGIRNTCSNWESETFDYKIEKRKIYIKLKDIKEEIQC